MGQLMRPRETAARMGISPTTLKRWRGRGDGPAFIRLGGSIAYDEADIDAYIQAHRVPGATLTSASEEEKA